MTYQRISLDMSDTHWPTTATKLMQNGLYGSNGNGLTSISIDQCDSEDFQPSLHRLGAARPKVGDTGGMLSALGHITGIDSDSVKMVRMLIDKSLIEGNPIKCLAKVLPESLLA